MMKDCFVPESHSAWPAPSLIRGQTINPFARGCCGLRTAPTGGLVAFVCASLFTSRQTQNSHVAMAIVRERNLV